MTTSVDAAQAELRDALAALRRGLEAVRAGRRTDQTATLQEQALSGALGADMRTLAERVRAGSTTWAEVFDGTASEVDLAHAHVAQMVDLHAPELRRRLR